MKKSILLTHNNAQFAQGNLGQTKQANIRKQTRATRASDGSTRFEKGWRQYYLVKFRTIDYLVE